VLRIIGPIVGPGLVGVIALVTLRIALGDRSRRWWVMAGVAALVGTVALLAVSAHLFLQLAGRRSWVVLMWSELAVLGAAAPPVLFSGSRGGPTRGLLAVAMLAGSLVVSSVGLAAGLTLACGRRADCFVRMRSAPGAGAIWTGTTKTSSAR
jgi:hypothetical protein